MSSYCAFSHFIPHVTPRRQQCLIRAHACCSTLCQSRHGDIPDSSLQSTGSSRSSHSRSPSLHHMHEEDKPVPRRSHSHGYPHGHSHRGRLRSVGFALTSSQTHLYLVMTQINEIFWINNLLSCLLPLIRVSHLPFLAVVPNSMDRKKKQKKSHMICLNHLFSIIINHKAAFCSSFYQLPPALSNKHDTASIRAKSFFFSQQSIPGHMEI